VIYWLPVTFPHSVSTDDEGDGASEAVPQQHGWLTRVTMYLRVKALDKNHETLERLCVADTARWPPKGNRCGVMKQVMQFDGLAHEGEPAHHANNNNCLFADAIAARFTYGGLAQ
jgi:hypothetical protein